MTITEMVRPPKKARFIHYRDQELWYVTDDEFEFPIPISDTEGATFLVEDKAIFFMRWIREHVINLDDARKNQSV